MATQTSTRTRSIWQNTRMLVFTTRTGAPRPAHPEQPKRATPAQVPAEKEADRWVVEMMFDHYNG